jgi:DNA-binding NarL/FixJ family response regulator
MIRVLVADDHPLMRAGIRAQLAIEHDMILAGEAVDGHAVRQLGQELDPDVVLLDLSMPGPPVLETIAYLRQHHPKLKIIILTAYDDEAFVRGIVPHVAGYVLKDETTEAVTRAIRTVMQGDTWFSRSVVDKLIQLNTEKPFQVNEPALTKREWEVLRLLAQGCSNLQIAEMLSIAERTVRFHLRNICDKIGACSRIEAALWAARQRVDPHE